MNTLVVCNSLGVTQEPPRGGGVASAPATKCKLLASQDGETRFPGNVESFRISGGRHSGGSVSIQDSIQEGSRGIIQDSIQDSIQEGSRGSIQDSIQDGSRDIIQ